MLLDMGLETWAEHSAVLGARHGDGHSAGYTGHDSGYALVHSTRHGDGHSAHGSDVLNASISAGALQMEAAACMDT